MKNKQDIDKLRQIVADSVRSLRKSAGLTQEQLSEAAGIAPQYLSRLETARHIPSIETLFNLANALQTTPAVLLGGLYSQIESAHANRILAMLKGLSDTDATFAEAQLASLIAYMKQARER